MKKGLRPHCLVDCDGIERWRWCPNEEGIKTRSACSMLRCSFVGGGALMKKGLRRGLHLAYWPTVRLEVVP